MGKDVAVVVIHGMGSQKPDFAESMISEINQRVKRLGKKPAAIAWRSIFWADVLEPRQIAYLRDANLENNLDYTGLRKFVISALGDASAYQKVGGGNTTYEDIHKIIRERIKALYETDLNSNACPLILFAHSLGGHIMSNYIWDIQSGAVDNGNAFENMAHLAGLVTFGCNIPLFTFAYRKVVPIVFPGKKLTTAQSKKAQWMNFYDPDDILGYPLKAINAAYDAVVDEDIAINVGSILTHWQPSSHRDYWTDNDFTKPASAFIAGFLSR